MIYKHKLLAVLTAAAFLAGAGGGAVCGATAREDVGEAVHSVAQAEKTAKKAQPVLKKAADKKNTTAASAAKQGETMPSGGFYYNNTRLPDNYREISIFGQAEATQAQAVAYIKANNSKLLISCTVEQLVAYYWEEAEREHVRPDLALCQALVETGVFGYGGDVHHSQNNFCGLGTTGGGVKGASFKTPQLGVRAHIQHLLAYAKKGKPSVAVIDPRYEMAHKLRLERGLIDKWYGLNGTWAMGSYYCEKIIARYVDLLAMPGGKTAADKDAGKNKSKADKKKLKNGKLAANNKTHIMRERVENILKEKRGR